MIYAFIPVLVLSILRAVGRIESTRTEFTEFTNWANVPAAYTGFTGKTLSGLKSFSSPAQSQLLSKTQVYALFRILGSESFTRWFVWGASTELGKIG